MWYLLYIALSVAVGVLVYRMSGTAPAVEQDAGMWVRAGAAPAEQAPPPSNFERLSISHDRLTWHDRIVGSLGLVVVVATGAAGLAFAIYLAASAVINLLEKAVAGPT